VDFKKEIRIIEGEGKTSVIFHHPSLTLFAVDNKTANALRMYIRGESLLSIANQFNTSKDSVCSLISRIKEVTYRSDKPLIWVKRDEDRTLGRLILMNTDCNLRCKYCYATHGSYGLKRLVMNKESTVAILEQAYSYYSQINDIMFFGGEPLLDVDSIEAACKYTNDLLITHRINRLPNFSIITNLTTLSSKFIELVNEYKISITASLDGPAYINDQQRIYPNGQGTFSTVARNIRKLKEKTGQPAAIEATYTRNHVDNNYDYEKLSKFFLEEFGIPCSFISPVIIAPEHSLSILSSKDLYSFRVNTICRTIRTLASDKRPDRIEILSFSPILALVNKSSADYHCPAGLDTISITPNGNIYPCYRFIWEDSPFYMGNIFNPGEGFGSPRFIEIRERFLKNRKSYDPACQDCWLRHLCKACLAEAYELKRDIRPCSPGHCSSQQTLIESLLTTIGDIRMNQDKWQKFLVNTRKVADEVFEITTFKKTKCPK